MKSLKVNLGENSYEIIFKNDLLTMAKEIKKIYNAKLLPIITDENVYKIYFEKFSKVLKDEGFDVPVLVLPQGEKTKSLESLNKIYNFLAENKAKRDTLLMAFGGGVIGDLCGFAAATYMRGMPFVQVPTTLLSMVDSSVGGKTAINLDFGKNMAGAFYQPKLVLINADFLETLSAREYKGGMAEVIKYGAIFSKELFEQLEKNCENAKIKKDCLVDIIYKCCDLKRKSVEADQFDKGERMLLNFGHTFGHAIEKIFNYEKYTHGEAVATGMAIASGFGEVSKISQEGTQEKILKILNLYEIELIKDFDFNDLTKFMGLDKKNDDKGCKLILLNEIGVSFIKTLSEKEIENILEEVSY